MGISTSTMRSLRSYEPLRAVTQRRHELTDPFAMDRPSFGKADGLIRAIAQDFETRDVLMDAFMNEEAFDETLRTGRAVYYSRSRGKLWRKGEESGHVQVIKDIRINCYGDSLLLLVEQIGGAACHT